MAKQKLVIVLIMVAIIQSFTVKAQTNEFKSTASVARPGNATVAGWQLLKFDDKGTNVKNGVQFYFEKAECSGAKVLLIKLFNTNSYAVNVSRQVSAEAPVVSVLVPALTTIEGSCTVTDGNLGKLIFTPPVTNTDEEKQKSNNFIFSHIIVTKAL